MDKREILKKEFTYRSKDRERIWGQADLNISDTIKFLKSSGFEDVTQKMLRDLDGIINPLKKDSGYRSFDVEKLSIAKIVLMLKAVGFPNKKITQMFELRQEIIDGLNIALDPKNDKFEFNMKEFLLKTDQYYSILREVRFRVENMKKVIDIGKDFSYDESERAENILQLSTIDNIRKAQFHLKSDGIGRADQAR